jgi:hypothetical protein
MTLGALDVGDETDAAGVMFIGWIVKTLRVHGVSSLLKRLTLQNSAINQIVQPEKLGSESN